MCVVGQHTQDQGVLEDKGRGDGGEGTGEAADSEDHRTIGPVDFLAADADWTAAAYKDMKMGERPRAEGGLEAKPAKQGRAGSRAGRGRASCVSMLMTSAVARSLTVMV